MTKKKKMDYPSKSEDNKKMKKKKTKIINWDIKFVMIKNEKNIKYFFKLTIKIVLNFYLHI